MSIERYEVLMNRENEREVVGYLELDPEGFPVFDVALTPVVEVDPDPEGDPEAPHISAWLLSPRTTLDTRRRRETPPYDHLDDGE